MMLNKLAERLRAVAANVSVAKPAKPNPVTRSAERATDADIVLPVMLEKPAQISNKEPPKPAAKVSGQTPDKLPPVTHPDRFPVCLKAVLKHEGGYVNHPKDPGGRTNLGVTQRVWENWVGNPATEQEMRGLTPDMVAPLYRQKYWDKVQARDLAPGLDLHVFDFGVNAGPARAIRYLQIMVGSNPDGKIGPATMRALSNYLDQYGAAKAINRYGELREQYYRQLRTFPTFGKGWLRRNREVTQEALRALA
jgi:hypothetical protein